MSKFKVGDRVRVYHGRNKNEGIIIDIDINSDCLWVRDKITNEVILRNPKQLRRLKNRKKVVWESENDIQYRTYVSTEGSFDIVDAERFCCEVLSQFIGKRVRIVITEAKEKP